MSNLPISIGLLVSICISMGACGQKGPLFLPGDVAGGSSVAVEAQPQAAEGVVPESGNVDDDEADIENDKKVHKENDSEE